MTTIGKTDAALSWSGLPSVVLAISHPVPYSTLPEVSYVRSGPNDRFGPRGSDYTRTVCTGKEHDWGLPPKFPANE